MLLERDGEDSGSDGASYADVDASKSYESMSDDEFWATIRAENAKLLGVSEEEVDGMSFDEIEDRLGIVTENPRFPQGSREGYRDVGSYDVLSEAEYERRKRAVEQFLED